MQHTLKKTLFAFFCGAVVGALLSYAGTVVEAATGTSTNYELDNQSIDAGADTSTSTNYKIEGTIGSFFTGDRSSESFTTGNAVGAGSESGGSGENQASPEVASLSFSYTDGGTPLSFGDGIALTPGTSTEMHIYGTVVDDNGADTITNVEARFYREQVAGGGSCGQDDIACYLVASCDLTPVNDTSRHYDCVIDLNYWTDATTVGSVYESEHWIAQVSVYDDTGFTSSKQGTIEMNTILALTIPSNISFGVLAIGASTSEVDNQEMVIEQEGNIAADIEVSATQNMTCSESGSIPKEQISWASTDVAYGHASTTPLSSTPTIAGLNVPRRPAFAKTTKTLYWNVEVPSSGSLGGTCTGEVVLSVITGSE